MSSLPHDRNGTSNDETCKMESGTSSGTRPKSNDALTESVLGTSTNAANSRVSFPIYNRNRIVRGSKRKGGKPKNSCPTKKKSLLDTLYTPRRNIFGTTDEYLSFELATNSYPNTKTDCSPILPRNFTFVIRDWGRAIAVGTVSHTTPDLLTVLQDIQGNEILLIRKQVLPSVSVECRAFDLRHENTVHKFEVFGGGSRIGLITFGDREPTRTCLKIFSADGNSQLVVRSVTKGEFAVFREQSSIVPLCNIKINIPFEWQTNGDFSGEIIFYPDTGITIEEQKLCTAASFVYKTCELQLQLQPKTTRDIEKRSTRIRTVGGSILCVMCIIFALFMCRHRFHPIR